MEMKNEKRYSTTVIRISFFKLSSKRMVWDATHIDLYLRDVNLSQTFVHISTPLYFS